MFRVNNYPILLVLLFFSYGLFSQQTDVEVCLKSVDSHLAKGDVAQALVIIEDFLFSDPVNITIQEKKINILVKEERDKEAFKDIEEYISTFPGQPEYYYLRAILNLQKQKFNKAIEDFSKSILHEMPREYQYKVYLNRGMAYFSIADFELAVSDFDEVIRLNAKNPAAHHGKGMIKYELYEYEDALIEFRKAIELEETNPITHYNLAMTYFRLDDIEYACYHFNQSCMLGHRNACRLLLMECTEGTNISK